MMKFLFVGGGTLGPVTPLLSTWQALKRQDRHAQGLWIGTPNGPEIELVEEAGLEFHSLPVVKLPRYFSPAWLTLPLDWWRVKGLANDLVRKLKPDAVITMGGFTAVPVVLAAAKLGIPCIAHQLDLIPGLTNRRISKHCRCITTSFEYEKPPFGDRVCDYRIATPTRYRLEDLPAKTKACHAFGLHSTRPTVLFLGGGSGSRPLNRLVDRTLCQWLELGQVIHLIGPGNEPDVKRRKQEGYVYRTLLHEQEMFDAYAAADLIVCRAGVGTLSEIAALKKTAILVPLPDSPQEANAQAFEERGAAIVVKQGAKNFDRDLLTAARLILKDEQRFQSMGEQAHKFFPTDDGSEFADWILKTVAKHGHPKT